MKLKEIKRIQLEFIDNFELDLAEQDLLNKFMLALKNANKIRKCGTGSNSLFDFEAIDLNLDS